MSAVICIRVPKELKERMRRLRGINWSEVIRGFIEETVSSYEVEDLIRRIKEDLKDIPELPSGTISRWFRIDRESH